MALFISPDLLPLVGQRVGAAGVLWFLFNILSGARADERAAAAKKKVR
jgi:hypothetical protein